MFIHSYRTPFANKILFHVPVYDAHGQRPSLEGVCGDGGGGGRDSCLLVLSIAFPKQLLSDQELLVSMKKILIECLKSFEAPMGSLPVKRCLAFPSNSHVFYSIFYHSGCRSFLPAASLFLWHK